MDDFVIINDINPYVPPNMPGTWSSPNIPYAKHAPVVEHPSDLDPLSVDNSPMCGFHTTMGDGTIQACQQKKPNCPMKRNVTPSYKIDNGLWSLDKKGKPKETPITTNLFSKSNALLVLFVVIILYIVYILS